MAYDAEHTLDMSGLTIKCKDISINNGTVPLSTTELGVLDSVTAGTVTASKAVVVDANKDISSFRNVTMSGALTLSAGGTFVGDSGTATAVAGAATLSKMAGIVTSESLTTAAAATYTLTLTNTLITATSNILVTVGYGTSTTGVPIVQKVVPGSGSASIVILNGAAAAALNGTILIQFFIVKP